MIVLEKEMATHSSVLAWRIPGTGEPWWAAVCGVAQSWTQLKRLSSRSSSSSRITPLFSIIGGGLSNCSPQPVNKRCIVSQNRYNYYVSNCVIVLKYLYIIQSAVITLHHQHTTDGDIYNMFRVSCKGKYNRG